MDSAQDEEVERAMLDAESIDKEIGDAEKIIEEDDEVEEAIEPIALRDPGQPTAKERADHELTHQPPRPWCDCCNGGRGQHDHHRAIPDAEELKEAAVPTISLDYCFMGDSDIRANRNPILVVYDNRSNMLGAWQTYEKGAVQWVAVEVDKFIEMIGYGHIHITLKSDGEASIVALKKMIAGRREAPSTLIETPVRESKCNGAMEVRVKTWQSQFRTMMIDLRKCIGQKVPLLSNATSWLVWWAATVLNKYKLDKAGRTPFQRISGVRQRRPIAKFGEKVLYMTNGKRDPGLKAEGNMFEGVFLGLRNQCVESLQWMMV